MSTLTATFTAPPWLDGARTSASFEYGRRQVCWQLELPDPETKTLHRCRYMALFVTVSERVAMKGEPLWLRVQRRETDLSPWKSLTEAASKAASAELLPAVARYGFGRLWDEVHRQSRGYSMPDASTHVAELEAEAAWWRRRGEVQADYLAGMFDVVPVKPANGGSRLPGVSIPYHPHERPRWEHVVADLVLDGEVVGHLTDHAHVVPAS